MTILNLQTAKQWAHSWDYNPRPGILSAAIDGLQLCVSVAREYGHADAEAGYTEARNYLLSLEVV